MIVVLGRSNAWGGGVVDVIVGISLLLALSPLDHVGLVQRAAGDVDFFLAGPSRRFDDLDPWPLFDGPRSDVVGCVVADGGRLATESEPTLHGLQEILDDLAADGDLNLHQLVALAVDLRVGLAAFVVNVLGHILSELVTFVAEGPAVEMDLIRSGAVSAPRGVVGKGFHHVDLVVVGLARVDRGGCEANLSLEGRHLWLHSGNFFGICRRRQRCLGDVMISSNGVVRRHLERSSCD